jgi:hypothetical protein
MPEATVVDAVPDHGALVISLDFELHWGVRDRLRADGPYRRNLLGARAAVLDILDCFRARGIAATWATVGFLFATSRQELESYAPAVRPAYRDRSLDPFDEGTGTDEADDPLHYAPSLIDAIRRTPDQELASHTFSHYYALEAGQDRETFRADLGSAVAIAATRDVRFSSIVFPRNQHNPDYDDVLLQAGIVCYRGNPSAHVYRAVAGHGETFVRRALRLTDSHLPLFGTHTTAWSSILQPNGLANVPASMFLRPCGRTPGPAAELRLRRICSAMAAAARDRRVFHLWWHPHNFGAATAANLGVLERIVAHFETLRERHGMRSLTMIGAATAAGAGTPAGRSRDEAAGSGPTVGLIA